MDFGQPRDFGVADALDGESTEVVLLGATVTGLAVRGWDEV